MIREVRLKRFKRFEEQTFQLGGHVVLAGPNNSGKTTLLQAIAAWQLALNRWKEVGERHRRGGGYGWVPIARQAFYAVPVRNFDWLWHARDYQGFVEIEVVADLVGSLKMELCADSTEQIKVRPSAGTEPTAIDLPLGAVRATFVPSMTGLSLEEPVYQRAKLEQLLGMGRPGEIIRNLLIEAHASPAWSELQRTMHRLFGCELLSPDGRGADIIAEYRPKPGGPTYDISSAGSGFQQILLLLTFLHVRKGSVLLVDEPDAHLHVLLQDSVYGELSSVAARNQSQLIIATHSEVIINSVEPSELYMFVGKPRRLEDATERKQLAESLRILSQIDVMLAMEAPGILYLEGHTDLALLTEWARVLDHPAHAWLSSRPFWKPTVWETRDKGRGIKARDHYEALKLVREELPGLIILDGDGREYGETPISGKGLQRLVWRRYEIESYLVHPAVLERFASKLHNSPDGQGTANTIKALFAAWTELFGSEELARSFRSKPLTPPPIVESYLESTKARTRILPPLLRAAGLQPDIEYTRFVEIAAVMLPEEIHPEIRQKLDQIMVALRLA